MRVRGLPRGRTALLSATRSPLEETSLMKFASPTSPAFTAVLRYALLLPITALACGSEAAPPVVGNHPSGGGGTGNVSQAPSGGSSAVLMGGSGVTPVGGSSNATPSGGASPALGGSAGMTSTRVGGMSVGGMSVGGSVSAGGSAVSSGGSAGASPDLLTAVGGPLTGQMLLGPCLGGDDPLVCQTLLAQCPGDKTDFALSGVLTTDKEITLGGDPATVYTITLHVQGEVEAKGYENAAGDQDKSKASPMADGFQTGGTPTKGDAYNVYMLRVTSPKQDYFFNSLIPPGKSDHTTYGIDYTGKIQANGGTKIRLVGADRNCSMIKNCGPNNNGGQCNAPITIANIDPKAKEKNPSFKFNEPYNGQWVVMVVTAVTAN